MSTENPHNADAPASENSERDANSPVSEPSPPSPASQRPTEPEPRPPQPLKIVEAQLMPVMNRNSFRPPGPYSAALKPKPSAAPAPRLRPDAPLITPAEINRAADPSLTSDQPLSAAEEIAGMFNPGRIAEAHDAQTSFDPSMMNPSPPPAKQLPTRSSGFDDPLFFRKTIIPILLTFGVILLGWGILLLTSGQNNALADLFPSWTPFALFGSSFIFFSLATFNMLSIKKSVYKSDHF